MWKTDGLSPKLLVRVTPGVRAALAALLLSSALDGAAILAESPSEPSGSATPLSLRHTSSVLSVAFSPDGKTLASASQDNSVLLWDLATSRVLRAFEGHRNVAECVAFSPDGKLLASASRDRTIRLWDPATGKELRQLTGHETGITSLAFAADSKTLASGSFDATVRLWDVSTGTEIRRFQGHMAQVKSVSLSADGKLLASAGYDHTVRLWDTATGKELHQLQGFQREVMCVALSPDGRLVATGGVDRPAWLWDTTTGKQVVSLGDDTGGLFGIAFSPDGRTVATGGNAAAILLWETATGGCRAQLNATSRVMSVAFSTDGQTLAAATTQSAVLIWDVPGRRRNGNGSTIELTAKELEQRWADLLGQDAARAYAAVRALAAAPRQTVPYLRARLRPGVAVELKQVGQLITDLDADDFAVREKASAELEKLGAPVATALRTALKGRPSLEAQRRMERILQKVEAAVPSGDRLRTLRAVEVLEQIGSPEARQVLDTLARGDPGAGLTDEARFALQRLDRRPPVSP